MPKSWLQNHTLHLPPNLWQRSNLLQVKQGRTGLRSGQHVETWAGFNIGSRHIQTTSRLIKIIAKQGHLNRKNNFWWYITPFSARQGVLIAGNHQPLVLPSISSNSNLGMPFWGSTHVPSKGSSLKNSSGWSSALWTLDPAGGNMQRALKTGAPIPTISAKSTYRKG